MLIGNPVKGVGLLIPSLAFFEALRAGVNPNAPE
jgi:hypothetical protein